MPQLPEGQREVKNWPVLDLGDVPKVSLADWRLAIDGLVEREITLTWPEFLALPQTDDTSDFHCVTTWSRMDLRWRGVRFVDLVQLAVPKRNAHFVLTTGYDVDPSSGEPYTTNLPLLDALETDVLLVHAVDGAPLPVEHGGPCRMITPQLYAWKGAKWIRRITLTADNHRVSGSDADTRTPRFPGSTTATTEASGLPARRTSLVVACRSGRSANALTVRPLALHLFERLEPTLSRAAILFSEFRARRASRRSPCVLFGPGKADIGPGAGACDRPCGVRRQTRVALEATRTPRRLLLGVEEPSLGERADVAASRPRRARWLRRRE